MHYQLESWSVLIHKDMCFKQTMYSVLTFLYFSKSLAMDKTVSSFAKFVNVQFSQSINLLCCPVANRKDIKNR